jgi:phage shock protein PspC (stress-responsive transcriptional regulator)
MRWFFKSETKNKEKKIKLKTFDEFVKYLSSPWRIIWINFVAGVFRGLGILIGMTVVLAVLLWVLTKMVDFPLIGEYFLNLKNLLESFSSNGNFH